MQFNRVIACVVNHASRFAADKSAVTAIFTALMAPIIVGFVGLGIDVGVWYGKKRDLQSATDAAAISAALTYIANHDAGGAEEIGKADAIRNGFDDAIGSMLFSFEDIEGEDEAEGEIERTTEVTMTEPQKLFFSGIFLDRPVVIRTRAVASATALPGKHCILALDPEMDGAVEFNGTANASINCGVASNSVSDESVLIAGSAILTADPVDSAGDIMVQGSATLNTLTPPRLGGTVPDPYDDLDVPVSPAACITADELPSGVTVNASGVSTSADNLTLVPGRYCNGLSLTNAENTQFAPGIYIIDRDEFRTTGSTSMHGDGVTFILTGSGTDYATVNFAGGTDARFTAPTEGPYAGILFYQDRNAPSFRGASLVTNSILGGSSADLVGVIYFPSQEVRFTGGAEVGGANRCLHLVARKVTVTGNAHIGSDCEGAGVKPIKRMVVKLIE